MTHPATTLPPGWTSTRLGEVCLPVGKVMPPDSPDDEFTYLDISSIDNKAAQVVSPKSYAGKDAPSRARQMVRTGDVLFSTVRTYLRNIAIVTDDLDGAVASTGFCVVRQSSYLNPGLAFNFLQTDQFISDMNPLQRGTNYPAVRDEDVLGHSFPLPPLAEQHRVVAEIEKQLTRLDASVAALRRARANLKRYRASVLKDACEGRLVPTEASLARAEGREYEHAGRLLQRILEERRAHWEAKEGRRGKCPEPAAPDTSALPELPEGWVWSTADQVLLESPQNGLYKPKTQYGDGTPILRIDDFQDTFARGRESLQRLAVTDNECKVYGLHIGQLVINRVNSPSHLGKCLVVQPALLPAVFESNMMRLTTSAYIAVSYLAYYLRSPMGRQLLTSNAKWAVNQASINQTDVCTTSVALPPFAEQKRIVAEVERRLSVVQQSEDTIDANLRRAERLRQSVLKRAFEGKLVPQDPNDEPASVLLERIRAERDAAEASETQRGAGRRGRLRASKREEQA